jgi:hypothetical protein
MHGVGMIPELGADLSELAGRPAPTMRKAEKVLKNTFLPQEEVPGLDIPHKIAYGAGQALPTIPTYLGPSAAVTAPLKALGVGARTARAIGNIAGFGGVEALQASPEGGKKALERGLEGAATGGILEALHPLGRLKRAAGMAATFGGQNVIENLRQGLPAGPAFKEGIPSAVIGAGMGLMGGKGKTKPPGEKVPPALPEALREGRLPPRPGPTGEGLSPKETPLEPGVSPNLGDQPDLFGQKQTFPTKEQTPAPEKVSPPTPEVPKKEAEEPDLPPPPPVGDKPNTGPDEPGKPMAGAADTRKIPIRQVRAGDVQTDVKGLQFKKDVDEQGVQKPLEGEWNEAAAGLVLLWERKDGTLFVANGHHRVAHAKSINPDTTLNAQVVREVDGFTMQDARQKAAEANILDGKGTVYDHAEYFRLTDGYDEADARKRGLAGKGFAIGKFATDGTYTLFRNRKITSDAAEAISATAPKDESLQNAGVAYSLKNPKADPLLIESFMNALKLAPEGAGVPQEQGGLFKFNDKAILQAENDAARVSEIVKSLREQLNAIRGASKRPEIAKKYGVDIQDPQGVQKKVKDIQNQIVRWSKWYSDPELVKQVRGPEIPGIEPPARGEKEKLDKAVETEEEKQKEAFGFLRSEGPKEVSKPKTSEEAQKRIDDLEDTLTKKYGWDAVSKAPLFPEEYQKMGVEPPASKISPDELSQLRMLYGDRDRIDRVDLSKWREAAIKGSGLAKGEAEKALDALGIHDRATGVYSTSERLKNWGREVTDNLQRLYNHFTQGKEDRTLAFFRWGGSAEDISLQGRVVDSGGRKSEWDQEALKKAEKVYNAIARTQSAEEISLSKIAKTQAVMTLRSEMPLKPQARELNAQEIKSLKAFGVSDPEIARLQKLSETNPEQFNQIMRSFAEEAKARGEAKTKGKAERMTDQGLFPGEKKAQGTLLSQGEGTEGPRPELAEWRNQIQGAVDQELKGLKGAPAVKIIDSIAELPPGAREAAGPSTEAMYSRDGKTIYVISSRMGDLRRVGEVIRHEMLGHYALDAMLTDAELGKFLKRVFNSSGKSGMADIAKRWGLDLDTAEGRGTAAWEKIALMAENHTNPSMLEKFYALLRDAIYKLSGGKWAKDLTDEQLRSTISKAQEHLRKGPGPMAEPTITLGGQPHTLQDVAQNFPNLQSVAGDTAKRFKDEDIIPKAYQFKEGLGKTISGIVHAAVPRHGVPTKILDLIMDRKGYMERKISEFMVDRVNQNMTKEFAAMPQADLIKFIDNVKTGTPQETPRLQQMDQFIRDLDRDIGEQYRKYKPDMNWIENHLRLMWKVIPGRTEEEFKHWLSRRNLEGSKGYFKQMIYPTLSEGIKAGGIPFSYNPMELMEMHYRDALKFISTQEMWSGLKDIGARVFVRKGEQAPTGFSKLNDKIAKVFFPAKERPVDLKMEFPERTVTAERKGRDFGMVQAGEWYVEENAARLLNNYLGRDYLRESPIGSGLMFWKNVSTAMELSLSPFHFAFETLEAVSSQFGLGLRKVWNQGKVEEGLVDMLKAPLAAIKMAKEGGAAMKYFANPQEFLQTVKGQDFIQKYPGAAEMIDDLFGAGGKLGMHEDYRINSLKTFQANLKSKNYIGAGLRSIPALNEMMMKPLFENYIPKLKWGLFMKEFSNELSAKRADIDAGKTTRGELARSVWDFVENRFGEMNFDNLFWDRNFKTSLQMLTRSVTWKMGNIRAYGNAITGQSAELVNALREGRMPKLTQEMAWSWGLLATTTALASIAQYAFTGKGPEEWKDMVYPKINEQGDRISLPTYMRDLFHVAHSPIKYVTSSMSGWIGRLGEVLNNKDFYGVKVHDPDDNVLNQRIDDMIHLVPLPFSFSTWQRMSEEGQGTARSITGFLGGTKAPYWIEKSPAQQLATEIAAEKLPTGGRSKAEFERYKLLKQKSKEFLDAQRSGAPTKPIMDSVASAVKAGKLQSSDVKKFQRRITNEPLEQTVGHLSLTESLRIWEKANQEEKKKIGPTIFRHFWNSRSPEERSKALPKLEEIRRELSK